MTKKIIALIPLLCILFACEPVQQDIFKRDSKAERVLIYYAGGYNNLGSYLGRDLATLEKSAGVPAAGNVTDRLLVVDEINPYGGNYTETPRPLLYEIRRNKEGKPVRDTLNVWPEGIACHIDTFTDIMNYIKDKVPSKSYGMIFSSHATGWLPGGYFADNGHRVVTRTIGDSFVYVDDNLKYFEMDMTDFARALPMPMEYILFDACFMGGVEVAYQLRNVCHYLGGSQTEIAASGFDYSRVAERLLNPDGVDIQGVCEDYYEFYKEDTVYGATISLIDCSKMDELALCCRDLFEKYRNEIEYVEPSHIQQYFRDGWSNHDWCYDLKDILVQSGINDEETLRLDSALKKCVVYQNNTENFMGMPLRHCCGLSMYLPQACFHGVDQYYEGLDWNKATLLVK